MNIEYIHEYGSVNVGGCPRPISSYLPTKYISMKSLGVFTNYNIDVNCWKPNVPISQMSQNGVKIQK